MSNREDILKRVLLNMKYNSNMTLNENYNTILSEQKKTPSVSAGEVETIGVIPEPIKIKNGSVVNTIDYNGKTFTFFGLKDKTINEKINEFLNKINSEGEKSYQDKPILVNTIKYIGPEWGRKAYKSYLENKIKLDDLRKHVGQENLKFEQKVMGYTYKNDTIGYVASRCKSDLQSSLREWAKSNNFVGNLEKKDWYAEPLKVLDCVKNSINTMFNNINKNGLFSFWATKPNTTEKKFFYLRFSCGQDLVDSLKSYQNKQFDPNAKDVVTRILTKCTPSSLKLEGYKSEDGIDWEKLKYENKQIVDKINKEKKEKEKANSGSFSGTKSGVEGGETDGEESLSIFLKGGNK